MMIDNSRRPDERDVPLDDEIDLLELWNVLWKRKWVVLIIGFLGMIASIVYALSLERQYTSTASFLSISGTSKSSLGNLAGIAGIAAIAGISLPTSGERGVDYMIILNNRAFVEIIIQQLDLIPVLFETDLDQETMQSETGEASGVRDWLSPRAGIRFVIGIVKAVLGMDEAVTEPVDEALQEQFIMTRAVKALSDGIVSVSKDSNNGLFTITVTWKDPFLAATIANRYIDELEKYLQANSLTTTRKSLRFIEQQLAKTEQQLAEYEERIKKFSETYGIFSVEDAASAISESVGKLQGEVILEEIKRDILNEFKGRNNEEVHLTNLKLEALRKRLAKLEGDRSSREVPSTSEITMRDLPGIGLEFSRLKRELIIQQEIYKMLRTQLESTKLEAEKESDVIQIIDQALPSEFPSKPNRKQIVMVGSIAFGGFSVFLVFFLEFVSKIRQARLRSDTGNEVSK